MGPSQDFNTTFGRVFGEDLGSPSRPPPPRSGYSPFDAPPSPEWADKQNFGVGFRRAQASGVRSAAIRTTCYHDIIARDKGSAHQVPCMRFDVSQTMRSSPTTAVTTTLRQMVSTGSDSALLTSPQMARRSETIFPSMVNSSSDAPLAPARRSDTFIPSVADINADELVAPDWVRRPAPQAAAAAPSGLCADEPRRRGSETQTKRPPTFQRKHRSLSPGLCRTAVHLKGATLLQEEPSSASLAWKDPDAAAQDGSVKSPQPGRFARKKGFPDRRDFRGDRDPQQPGAQGGEFAESVEIGEVRVPENLELRAEQAELTKKIVNRHSAPVGLDVNEWQYRTREIVTQKSKERGRMRWN